MAEEILLSFHAEREVIRDVCLLVKHHDDLLPNDNYALRKLIAKRGEKYFFRMLSLKRADTRALHSDYHGRLAEFDALEAQARALLAEKPCFSVRDLALNGEDVMALGVPRGRIVGEALAHLLDLVMAEKLENEKCALLKECKQFLKEKGLFS